MPKDESTLPAPAKLVKEESPKKGDDEKKEESVYDKWKKNNNRKDEEATTSSKAAAAAESDNEEKEKKAEIKPSPKKVEQKRVDPRSILRGVIFALSGFENPLRSEIRDKGLKLGAKYRPDWTDDCTHLV